MTEIEINARLAALVSQRDSASNQIVVMAGELAKLRAENKTLAEENEQLLLSNRTKDENA